MSCIHTFLPSLPTRVSSVPCFLTPFWSLKVTNKCFTPFLSPKEVATGCAVILSSFLMMLRMWMKELQPLPKSSHWEISQGPCWPPWDWSSPSHQAEGPQCPVMFLQPTERAGPLSLYWLQRAVLLPLLPRGVQAVCSSSLPTKKWVFLPFWLKLLVCGGLQYRDPLFILPILWGLRQSRFSTQPEVLY